MDIREKMREGFRDLEGGLFSKVEKADVGDAAEKVARAGGDMLGWADPFMPDDCMPEEIKALAIQRIQEGLSAHYTHPVGDPELKRAIARKLQRQNCLTVDPERNILVTPGSDSGLLFAMIPFIGPGDEVLVPDPSYPSNFLNPKLLGGKAVSVPLDEENGFRLTREALERALSPRSKMVLLTNPNNPTSTVFSREELTMLAEFICEHDLVAVVDQAFEDFVFDGREMITLASLPGMWERTITVCSVSKGMAMSGVRVGYLTADDYIMDVLYGCAVNIIGATNSTFQTAVAYALDHPELMMGGYYEVFEERRRKVHELLTGIPGVRTQLPQSAFLTWVDVSDLGTAEEVSSYLMREAKVCVNAGTAYGKQGAGHIRIVHGCFQDSQRIYRAVGRVREALLKLGREKGLA
ncbi:MAG: pyridoxal phosphate-dependent aminotransferase [Candidatus Spyradocola sp.]|jgi:aspartate/methionine/tyrosine aminotransferase